MRRRDVRDSGTATGRGLLLAALLFVAAIWGVAFAQGGGGLPGHASAAACPVRAV